MKYQYHRYRRRHRHRFYRCVYAHPKKETRRSSWPTALWQLNSSVVIFNLWETWSKGGNNSSEIGLACHLSAGWKVIRNSMLYVLSRFHSRIVAPELIYFFRYIFLFIHRWRCRINCYTVIHIHYNHILKRMNVVRGDTLQNRGRSLGRGRGQRIRGAGIHFQAICSMLRMLNLFVIVVFFNNWYG